MIPKVSNLGSREDGDTIDLRQETPGEECVWALLMSLIMNKLSFSSCETWHTNSFIHSFNKYLLSTYYMPNTVVGTQNTSVDNTEKSLLS